jgi:hypothetical protein
MDFLPKYFYRDFELSLSTEERPKTYVKKKSRKNILGFIGSSKANQIYAGVRRVFF